MEQLPALPALEADYEIVRELGRGGTAVVYLARERSTDLHVAIKLIRPKYLQDEEAQARFVREARFVTQLDHPSIVPVRTVLHLGPAGIALVMPHVAGRTLKQLVYDEHPLAVERVERVVRDVAGALGAAHALAIVHRDVKPENVFVDEGGRAMLADFGVARSMTGDTQLTMAGVAIGTPAYMAPEQIDGADLDGRADIYSLGLVAWEALTGRRPWSDADGLYSVLYRQKHEQLPDVRRLRPDVPDRVADVIAGAVEKDRDARWQNVNELIQALDGILSPRHHAAPPPASNETARFERPVTPDDLEPARPATATILAQLAASGAFKSEFAPRLTRRPLVLGALVGGSVLVALLAVNLHGRPERIASLPQAPPIQTSATGDVAMAATPRDVFRPLFNGAPSPLLSTPLPSARIDSRASAYQAGAPIRPVVPTVAILDTLRSAQARSVPSTPSTSSTASTSSTPTAAASRVTISAGGAHTCLVTPDGRAFCWGGNDRGQLGAGGTSHASHASRPSAVAGDLRFASMSSGLSHTCAITRAGPAWCWGDNDHGQLGDRSTTSSVAPVRVADDHTFRAIAAGAWHTCALDAAGTAWCWGANDHGQLGDRGTLEYAIPIRVAGTGHFASLHAGWNFTCALAGNGRAMCWGENSAGQLGDGGGADRREPVPVRGGLAFTALTTGSAHACGLTGDGDIYCWGRNTSGQLGDGTTTDHGTPMRVKTDLRFAAIAAGAVHTCAIAVFGDTYCWGQNIYGQLGDGGTSNQQQPALVVGAHAFSSLRAFGSHTCATTVSSEVFCWGYNLDGQLGDGTRTHRSRPVYVEPPSGG